jgi:hypothetical protein
VGKQARALDKEAMSRAIVDGEGVRSLLTDIDMHTWHFDPVVLPPGEPTAQPCDNEEHMQCMEAVVRDTEAHVAPGLVVQVCPSDLRCCRRLQGSQLLDGSRLCADWAIFWRAGLSYSL